jgi:hypothetical protein
MKSERKVIMLKAETVAGTDPVPVVGTDGFAAIDFAWGSAAKATTDEFDYAASYLGARDQFTVNLQRDCSFVLPVIGAGTPLGTTYPAALLAAYRACGHASTVVASTSVTLNPVSTGEETATLYANEDGFLRKMTYCRGSMKWMFEENKVPRCQVALAGVYSTPADATLAALTLPTLQKPVGFNKTNTTVTLGALALKCSSVQIDGGRTNAYMNAAGFEGMVVQDCKPLVELKFELPTATQKNIYQELETTVSQALTVVHGTVSGNKFTFNGARAQLVDLSEQKDRGQIFVTAKFALQPSTTGNDQYTIVLT